MRDVNYNKGTYDNWKEYALKFGIEGISRKSSQWIMRYLFDLDLKQAYIMALLLENLAGLGWVDRWRCGRWVA